MPHGQHDQDRAVVAPRRYEHGARRLDAHRNQVLVAGAVGGHHVAAQFGSFLEPLLAGVHHHDAARIGSALDQLAHRLRARNAEADHHHMVGQPLLDALHAELLPASANDEVVGRAHEDEQDREPDRGDYHRLDQPCAIGYRSDVAEPRGGDRDHREIDHVEQADLPVVAIDQPFAVGPVYRHHHRDESEGQADADEDVAPYRQLELAAERVVAGLDALGPHHGAILRRTARPARRARRGA